MSKERLSNIELLRILAMFMILVIHANIISIPKPSYADLVAHPCTVITRYFFESLGIVGVNIFVLISGWFTIKSRAKSFLSFFFQIFVLWGGVLLLLYIGGGRGLWPLKEVLLLTNRHWFVKSYIVLMIIAPVLNTFAVHSTERQQRIVLIGFFLFMCSYGWIGGAKQFFLGGYGPLMFVGLYLLANYIHNKSTEAPISIRRFFSFNRNIDLLIYIACTLVNTFLGIFCLYLEKNQFSLVYAYDNPLTIIGALYLFLFFSKFKIEHNKIINTLAAGSFAVYLLHTNSYVFHHFSNVVKFLYDSYNGYMCIAAVFLFLVLVYVTAVAIDLPRKWVWTKISNHYQIK